MSRSTSTTFCARKAKSVRSATSSLLSGIAATIVSKWCWPIPQRATVPLGAFTSPASRLFSDHRGSEDRGQRDRIGRYEEVEVDERVNHGDGEAGQSCHLEGPAPPAHRLA